MLEYIYQSIFFTATKSPSKAAGHWHYWPPEVGNGWSVFPKDATETARAEVKLATLQLQEKHLTPSYSVVVCGGWARQLYGRAQSSSQLAPGLDEEPNFWRHDLLSDETKFCLEMLE